MLVMKTLNCLTHDILSEQYILILIFVASLGVCIILRSPLQPLSAVILKLQSTCTGNTIWTTLCHCCNIKLMWVSVATIWVTYTVRPTYCSDFNLMTSKLAQTTWDNSHSIFHKNVYKRNRNDWKAVLVPLETELTNRSVHNTVC